MPVSLSRVGIEERLAQLDLVADGPAVVAEELDVVVDERVEPERGRRELVGDARIDGGIVAAVAAERALPQAAPAGTRCR